MTNTRNLARLGLMSLAATISFAALPAQAQEGSSIKNILGSMGVISPEKDPIRYRERAPLVLPPKAGLPAPTAPGNMAAADPAWPKDEDVEKKRRLAAEERVPVTESEAYRMGSRNPRLTPEEMRTGRVASSAPFDAAEYQRHRGDNSRDVLLLTPQQLAAGAKPDEEDPGLTTEPKRKSLSEPPSGFRKPQNGRLAATVATPKIDQQAYDANPINWLTRKFTGANEED